MPPGWAKLVVLPILKRWDTVVLWSVTWPIDEALSEVRWFKEEPRAVAFAANIRDSSVQPVHFQRNIDPLPMTEDDYRHTAIANMTALARAFEAAA